MSWEPQDIQDSALVCNDKDTIFQWNAYSHQRLFGFYQESYWNSSRSAQHFDLAPYKAVRIQETFCPTELTVDLMTLIIIHLIISVIHLTDWWFCLSYLVIQQICISFVLHVYLCILPGSFISYQHHYDCDWLMNTHKNCFFTADEFRPE